MQEEEHIYNIIQCIIKKLLVVAGEIYGKVINKIWPLHYKFETRELFSAILLHFYLRGQLNFYAILIFCMHIVTRKSSIFHLH